MNQNSKNILEYKGYNGSIDFSLADNCLFGKVIGIRPSITYEGNTLDELRDDFQNGIDDYLNYCNEKNMKPEKPFSGVFNVRLTPESHKQAVLIAQRRKISLNKFIRQSIEHEIENEK